MSFSEDRATRKFNSRYLLIAENPYLLWDALEDWKSAWQAGGRIPLDSFRPPRIDFDRLLDIGATIPMFGEQRLVVVHDVNQIAAFDTSDTEKVPGSDTTLFCYVTKSY